MQWHVSFFFRVYTEVSLDEQLSLSFSLCVLDGGGGLRFAITHFDNSRVLVYGTMEVFKFK